MSLVAELSALTGTAFERAGLPASLGGVVVSQRPELAQFQCNGAMAGAAQAGRSPRSIAEEVTAFLAEDHRIARATVAGPGFINIDVTPAHLAATVSRLAGDRGEKTIPQPLRVIVDYGGPNVAKAMHVGHLRATIIGEALARMFAAAGHAVIRDPHFGDWGTQMGMLIVEVERRHPDLPYFDPDRSEGYPADSPVTLEDLQEIYPTIAARCAADPVWADKARAATVELQQGRPGYRALWQHMVNVSQASQRKDFADLGVEFDVWYGESTVAERLAPMIDRIRPFTDRSNGALIVNTELPGDKRELPPLLLQKTDGGFLYSTTDLATIEMRVDDLKADVCLYVVDARQADHFEQLFRVARSTGIGGDCHLEHIKFGTMNGPDGRPFKTREGGVVRLRDLIGMVTSAALARLDAAEIASDYEPQERAEIARMVGLAALKFGDLSNHRTSDYLFDVDRFVSFEGKTGPYLQYGAVRIKSILRNAEERNLTQGPLLAPAVDQETALMLELTRQPEVLERAIELRAPNHIAEYAYGLAGAFNRFYDACHILSETDTARQASWLSLIAQTLAALSFNLGLLGIEIPDRM